MLSLSKRSDSQNQKGGNVSRLLRYSLGTLCGLGIAIGILMFSPAKTTKAQSPHSATLTWAYTQGTDLAVGFNVYRSLTSGGPYSQINTSLIPITTLTYRDTIVIAGTTYYYVVDAQDVNNVHSAYSAESLPAVIPSNPTTPTRPTVVVN